MDEIFRKSALEYHREHPPGKISVTPTKGLVNQRDLALAYSPGVAAACEEIVQDPHEARNLTAKGNLIGVVTNGTAVLGLGSIGPLAAKPVMEGKSVLFKKFAGIDSFDIEINEQDPDRLVEIIAALEPTFGGINLEDIKAPECFYIEKKLRERLRIPVFHDDQHGTAIIVGAAILNGLEVVGKRINEIKLVTSGAGAAALACLDLLVSLGLPNSNIWVTDIGGVVFQGRLEEMDDNKSRYAQDTPKRQLIEVMDQADVFLGLSAGGVLNAEMVRLMAPNPIILALANPEPEILPEIAKDARPDAILATGRSDYPNQVNNVLCFPFIFRGALDVGATTINEAMKIAAVHAIAELARAEQSEIVAHAYDAKHLQFGPDYLIPKPFDPRLISTIAPAVARAAMESGVALRPCDDLEGYRESLTHFVYTSGLVMRPIFSAAKTASNKRIVYAEGEDKRVLHAVQVVVDEDLAHPILIGRREVIEQRIKRYGLRIRPEIDFELVNPQSDARYRQYHEEYFRLTQRCGVSPQYAKIEMRRRATLIGAMMLHFGEADGLICGTFGSIDLHLDYIQQVLGTRSGVRQFYTVNMVLLPERTLFIGDTGVHYDPSAEQIAEMAWLASEKVSQFGLTPKAALLSHSSFGSSQHPSAVKMRKALHLISQYAPDLEVEGEMHGDAALSDQVRRTIFPNSVLEGSANLLLMPNLDAAHIAFNLLMNASGDGITIGPILLGASKPVHILTPSATVRRLVNMTALTVMDAHVPE